MHLQKPQKLFVQLEEMAASVKDLPSLSLPELPPEHTVLVVMDLVNGFAKEGPLSSPYTRALIEPIRRLSEHCRSHKIPILHFADCHPNNALEFTGYPPHCLQGSRESRIVSELRSPEQTVIQKNSTNGFVEPAFQEWFATHPERTHYLLAGDCTDICVLQFATTLKAWFNTRQIPSRIILPLPLADTYDAPGHGRDLCNLFALCNLRGNGIECVKELHL